MIPPGPESKGRRVMTEDNFSTRHSSPNPLHSQGPKSPSVSPIIRPIRKVSNHQVAHSTPPWVKWSLDVKSQTRDDSDDDETTKKTKKKKKRSEDISADEMSEEFDEKDFDETSEEKKSEEEYDIDDDGFP